MADEQSEVANSESFPSTGLTEGTRKLRMRNERLWLEKERSGDGKEEAENGEMVGGDGEGEAENEEEAEDEEMEVGNGEGKARDGEGKDGDGEGETEDGGMEDRDGEDEDGMENRWWVWIKRGWGWRLGHL